MRKIPGNVYYRCIWLVRDSKRLRELVEMDRAASENAPHATLYGTDLYSDDEAVIVSEAVIQRAEEELDCMDRALSRIPEAYQDGILANIISKDPFADTAHPNTWKKWKQQFIFELAKELHLI